MDEASCAKYIAIKRSGECSLPSLANQPYREPAISVAIPPPDRKSLPFAKARAAFPSFCDRIVR